MFFNLALLVSYELRKPKAEANFHSVISATWDLEKPSQANMNPQFVAEDILIFSGNPKNSLEQIEHLKKQIEKLEN